MKLAATILLGVVVLFLGFSSAWAKPEPTARLVDHFTLRWSSVQYNKSVAVYHPEVSPTREQTFERLSLTCEIKIGDPNLILGTSAHGVITQLIDSRGLKLEMARTSGRARQRYEGLRYRRRFTQPPTMPRWKELLRSTLRLPTNTNFTPQLVDELQPSRLELQLDTTMLEQGTTEIRRLDGYFYALVAESFVNVDVRFEPNNTWVTLTPEIEIRVREAYCDGGNYRLHTEVSPGGRASMRPLESGAALPQRLVVDRQFLGPDGKPVQRSLPFRHLPIHLGGQESGSGPNLSITTIRYVIAVHPGDQKIPFVLEHIPLPRLEP